jgi:hypothetical protein
MAHPRRAHYVEQLCRKLDYDVPVVWDRRNDVWDTGSRSLLTHDSAAMHHVVIQDDALICHDLIAGVREMLRHVPAETPVGLFVGGRDARHSRWKSTIRRAERTGHRFFTSRDGSMWGVGLVIPTVHIAEIVRWCEKQKLTAYDGRVRRWYRHMNITTWYTVPSLVDHRSGPNEPSMFTSRRNDGRSAFRFIGENSSALDVDWATGVTR